jgi:carbon-monoxide dehydrogenase medium subunit
MYAFNYHRPATIADALAKLRAADDGKLMAGGMTLIPTLKQRLAGPTDLIDLGGIAELKSIVVSSESLTIGAMTTHDAVASSGEVRMAVPALSALAYAIGDPQVRNRGTIGGSIANNDPAADYPAAVLALGAVIHTDRRQIPADEFFTGLFETALAPDELITKVTFPTPERSGYAKFYQRASRYALVGVFVAKKKTSVRVAVTGAASCVFRLPQMEEALTAKFSPSAIDGIEVSADGLNSDLHASAEYRAHLIGVMARRAVAGAR